ncbi:MAG: glycosyltransferase, partial [Thermodesulfovibrionales bacterium]|nr:glycosyltransferase [Thermodesulfovibrionales bacterium]
MGKVATNETFLLLLPSSKRQESWELPPNVKPHFVHRSSIRELSRMWDINFGLARLAEKLGVDLYLTFGDLGPVARSIPHVIYLHQAYMVYTEPELIKCLPLMERIKLRYQRNHFSRSARNASAVVVQTPVMAERVVKLYRLPRNKVAVIRPPLPSHVQKMKAPVDTPSVTENRGTLNLLFLATYYAHKNHAILPGVVQELRRRNLTGKVHIRLTLDGNRRKAETSLLSNL